MSPFEKCRVCEDDTDPTNFYGAIVCNPCRTFFRRQVLLFRIKQSNDLLLLLKRVQPLKCKRCQRCLISGPLRKKCGWCRFQKCLAIGMKPDLVKTNIPIMNQMKYLEISSSRADEISSHEIAFVSNPASTLDEEQQYPMCYDTSVVPSQQLYWKYNTAHVTPHFFKEDLRHVTPLSWQQLPSLGPPEKFWLKKPAGSSIEYTLIDMIMTPGATYCMTVDVHDEALKSFDFSNTSKSSLDLPTTALIMTSIQGCNVFHRQSGSLGMPVFDVQIISKNQSNSSPNQVVMKSLTEGNWKRLQEMTKAHKFWETLMAVHVPDVDPTNSHEARSLKRLFLSTTTDVISKNITLGIEALEIIQGISLEDQLIVTKEAYFALLILLTSHSFDKHLNAYVLYSPETRDILQMCIHIDSKRADYSTELYDMYRNFLEECYEFLRVDCVFITLLSLLIVYNDVPGLSCSKLFEQERSIYAQLLDMYIDAKIESKEWKLSKIQIWDHIAKLMTQLAVAKYICVNFARQQYQAIDNSHVV